MGFFWECGSDLNASGVKDNSSDNERNFSRHEMEIEFGLVWLLKLL